MKEKTFKTLLKVLMDANLGSRRRMADAVMHGSVRVNGIVVADLRHPVDVNNDRITVDGSSVDIAPKKHVYLMLNKPAGVLCTVHDERGRSTVIDILPAKYRNLGLHPVGRLDKESTGLLLLTSDGELTYRLTHPRFEHEKEYLVRIDGSLKPGEMRLLERGVELEDGLTYGAVVKTIHSTPPFNYSITLHEGRKRQVRRMFASIGYKVSELRRVRVGNLEIGDLKEGCVRRLGDKEVLGLHKRR